MNEQKMTNTHHNSEAICPFNDILKSYNRPSTSMDMTIRDRHAYQFSKLAYILKYKQLRDDYILPCILVFVSIRSCTFRE